ncbi:DUF2268 domain-containing protein [Bacillus alkalicellulosilyticus]|uniref:DUF2268 domain-containing protein n=1 Tax=Alkalihalobacterium alkalicellulosilyticum TaxID=1912214 RepID=UPI000995E462|nr:DUF2268 domain-containing putative Zn-dependent protease [Bacillus alkalicellulosilyticus]
MGVIATFRWLQKYSEKTSNVSSIYERQLIQQDTLIKPLSAVFDGANLPELHRYLLEQGLVHPDVDISPLLIELEDKKVWHVVRAHYTYLKEKWSGPDTKVFIFPLEERNELMMKQLGGKMGLGFRDKVVLFLSPQANEKEIKALLTHEYHHVCRLNELNKNEEELSLLDSILIEGLAERAVEEEVGSQYLGKWSELYTEDELKQLWQSSFIRALSLKGKKRHNPYLFGDFRYRIPEWAGYSVGYDIAKKFQTKTQMPTAEMVKLASIDILTQTPYGFELN